MDRQPFSVRQGWRPKEELFEGVPDHLFGPLVYWMQGTFGYRSQRGMNDDFMLKVVVLARLPVAPGLSSSTLQNEIIQHCLRSPEGFLDTLDAILCITPAQVGTDLKAILVNGGSKYTVAHDGKSLQVRVDAGSQKAADELMSAGDTAAEEIQQAWSAAFGRNPNASDAWDHAIKAVEAVLIPVVVPKQDKAQLGHVVGALRSQGNRWRLLLSGADQSYDVGRLVSMLELLWPNPDRHANNQRRMPTLSEAQSVVHLAVAIVQLSKIGILTMASN